MRMDDGMATLITLANAPDIEIWEKSVTPPGLSGGGAIDTTTMRNTSLRTNAPKKLKTVTPLSLSAAYDPAVYTTLKAQINVNQAITVTFPDGSTVVFWGWVDDAQPGANEEGTQPTIDITIQPSNMDASGAEIDVAYTAPSVASS